MINNYPMVNIILTHKGNCIDSIGLVDSGSTSTFIPLNVSKELQIDLKGKNDDVAGAGGNFSSYMTEIENLKINNKDITITEFVNLMIRVPYEENGIPFVVLGRDSIFQRFNIRFDELKQEIHLLKPGK